MIPQSRDLMSKRLDFSDRTKRIIAARAGYRCSFPGCRKPTVGPGGRPEEFISTGVAAHIFSAAPGGPRGQGGLTTQDLVRPENGIWLCENHARLVDANRGSQ